MKSLSFQDKKCPALETLAQFALGRVKNKDTFLEVAVHVEICDGCLKELGKINIESDPAIESIMRFLVSIEEYGQLADESTNADDRSEAALRTILNLLGDE